MLTRLRKNQVEKVNITFAITNPSYGTVTLGGTTVTNGTIITVNKGYNASLVMSSVNTSNYAILSYAYNGSYVFYEDEKASASYTYTFTSNATLTIVFMPYINVIITSSGYTVDTGTFKVLMNKTYGVSIRSTSFDFCYITSPTSNHVRCTMEYFDASGTLNPWYGYTYYYIYVPTYNNWTISITSS
jgi:hypothetical protein